VLNGPYGSAKLKGEDRSPTKQIWSIYGSYEFAYDPYAILGRSEIEKNLRRKRISL
jgi:hypothetical protein